MAHSILFGIIWLAFSLGLFVTARSRMYPLTPELVAPFELQKSWAQYSPYFSARAYEPPPSGCQVTQVNIIHRHGARYPTLNSAIHIAAAISKLQQVPIFTDPRLAFLANYTYDLGTDDLVPSGAEECQNAGRIHYKRYSHLVAHDNLPFVRASGSERVILSATNWTAGFASASHHVYEPSLSVIIPEDPKFNNTLDRLCPNAGDSDPQVDAWLDIYGPPLAARINGYAPGAGLIASDAFGLLSLCAFETVAKGSLSPFCNLFNKADFEDFEYSGDLDKYYNTGYGQELGKVQGVGYVNELIARLTGQAVRDHTQTNHTLDASPVTFPLNRTIYADFSHDNTMIAIYTALGLFPQESDPDPTYPRVTRTWRVSEMVPFAAQLVTEKLVCGEKEFVRILVNDAWQPLKFCGAGRDGLCELSAFVDSQSYARHDGEGDFEKCFA